jgi:hypothetical protein
LREGSWPENRGRQLADNVDPFVEIVALVVSDEAMEQFVFYAEDADRLRMMDESYRGDVAGEINTDQEDQRTVGETL